jgi:hypothetical protein
LSTQQSWSVGVAHTLPPAQVLGFDEQHADGLHVVPPQTMLLPAHVGLASASQMPGVVALPLWLQWKPGWQPVVEPSALQHSCSLFCWQVAPAEQALGFVVQHVPATQAAPPHSSVPPLQVGGGIASQTPGVPAVGWWHR